MAHRVRLLSTDFDGTVVNHHSPPPVNPGFLRRLETLRARGVAWAINTGRNLSHTMEGLAFFGLPTPDYALTSEREVFQSDGAGGWTDFGPWNQACTAAHDELHAVARPVFDRVKAFVDSSTRGRFIDDDTGIGVVAATESELARILEKIDAWRADVPNLGYQVNTVYLRFCHTDYSKGAALGELRRLLGLAPDEVFAAGDHLNDLPMLDGREAAWVACPGNSAGAVKLTVRDAGGYIARGDASDGLLEALDHFAID
jgi:HAD superfamily hydrolase (TIGR01484 family)